METSTILGLAGDIPLAMVSLLVIGIGLWLVYGIMLRDIPLVVANTITLALAASILYVRLRHG
jgi:MtN3 and saliva related transmembrane protein